MKRGFLCGELGEVRRRTRIKNRKIKKNYYDLKIEEQYGITVNELDIILYELCHDFKCQWTVVAKELFRQHGIRMANNAIRERYSSYLDPNLRKEWYTEQEAASLTKMFWIEGKNYQEINKVFGNHGRGAVRQCLCYAARRGLSRLIKYLNQDQNHPSIVLSSIARQYFVSAICSQGTVEWTKYRYSYLLFYFFIYNQGESIQQIPRELARTLYERLANRSHRRLKERAQYYSKVNPSQNFEERLQQRKERYYEYLKTYRKANKQGSSEQDQSDGVVEQAITYTNQEEEMNIDIGNLSVSQWDDLDAEDMDITNIELKENGPNDQ